MNYNQIQGNNKILMEPGLDKNGNWIQRRKMYDNQFPLHNLKSQFRFDWQGDEHSFQDMHGHRYRIKMQNEKLIKKYNQSLDKKFKMKYVECVDDNQLFMQNMSRISQKDDILNKQIEQFNHSKIAALKTIDVRPPQFNRNHQSHQHDYRTNNQAQVQGQGQGQGSLQLQQRRRSQQIYQAKLAEYNSKDNKNDYNDRDRIQKEPAYQNNKIGSPSIQYVPKYVPKYPNYLNYNTIVPTSSLNYNLQQKRQSQSYNKHSYPKQKDYRNGLNPQRNLPMQGNTYQTKSPRINLNLNDFHS